MAKKKQKTESEFSKDVSTLNDWGPARHVADPVPTKIPTKRITINLDQDIVAIFKMEASLGGPPYQTAINNALRKFLRDREISEGALAARTVLNALKDKEVLSTLRALLNDDAA